VQNGESEITALRFSQEGQLRGRSQAFAARSTVSFGLEALGATHNEDAPDGRFVSWLGQAQYALRLNDSGQQLLWRGDVQLTDRPLLPIEQIAIGGLDTVRGYRENLLVRDNGWITSLEWRIPLFRLPAPYLSRSAEDGLLQLAPFVDAGGGWFEDGQTPEPTVISGIGAGLRWQPATGWLAAIYYGKALKDVRNPDNRDLQDYGIYFDVRMQVF
jgi:hemolysin activation/secretion protein